MVPPPIDLPAPAVSLPGTLLRWGAFVVTVPDTLAVTDLGNGLAMDKTGCRISMWPSIPAQADLAAQALAYLESAFADTTRWGGIVGEIARSPLDDSYHHTGITGDGWRYVDLRGELLDRNGTRSGQRVRILLTDVAGQAAPMIGYQTVPGCIDEVLDPHEFLMLSYSMGFPASGGDPAALGSALLGGWFGSAPTLGLAWSDVFAANGQHSDLYGVQSFRQISPNLIQETFSTWQGNGRWRASRNVLAVWPVSGAPSAAYFRIYAETGGFVYLRRLARCGDHYCERSSTKD